MNVVESRHVREILHNRAKCLRANGMEPIAEQIIYDIGKIMQHETFININNSQSLELRAERIGRNREFNND